MLWVDVGIKVGPSTQETAGAGENSRQHTLGEQEGSEERKRDSAKPLWCGDVFPWKQTLFKLHERSQLCAINRTHAFFFSANRVSL